MFETDQKREDTDPSAVDAHIQILSKRAHGQSTIDGRHSRDKVAHLVL
jgi:hypothetical protein